MPGRCRRIQRREHALISLDGELFDAVSGRARISPDDQGCGQCRRDHLSIGHFGRSPGWRLRRLCAASYPLAPAARECNAECGARHDLVSASALSLFSGHMSGPAPALRSPWLHAVRLQGRVGRRRGRTRRRDGAITSRALAAGRDLPAEAFHTRGSGSVSDRQKSPSALGAFLCNLS